MLKLSIVVPIYNMEKYLDTCLRSLTESQREDYELILVNDGSTDRSEALAAAWAERQSGRIRLISTPNGGLGAARNVGLEAAQGEYLLFVDSDDTLRLGAVDEILPLLDGSFDILIFDFVSCNEAGRVFSRSAGCSRTGTFRFAEYPQLLFDPPSAWNKVWKRSLFMDTGIRFPGGIWFEDLATSPRLYLHAGAIRYVPEDWYRYLQRSGSITNAKSPERNREMIPVLESVMDYYRQMGVYERYRQELEYMACYHQLLVSSTRVSQAQPHSPVLEELRTDFLRKFPNFWHNPYVRRMPLKYKFLLELIADRLQISLSLAIKLNNLVRRKKL